jgi:hypothetical protein|tara:strand:- start:100 stop:270 length:171 start_codon:yes stop_codon:yes gene_type:complete
MNLSEIKKKLEYAYQEEDWNLIEDLIDVLDTLVTIGEGDDYGNTYDEDGAEESWIE